MTIESKEYCLLYKLLKIYKQKYANPCETNMMTFIKLNKSVNTSSNIYVFLYVGIIELNISGLCDFVP